MSVDMVARALDHADLDGKAVVLERLPDIFRRFAQRS